MELIGTDKLSFKSKKVGNINDITNGHISVINDMIKTCRANNGIAIAAPQVGIFSRYFVSLVDLTNMDDSPTLYINPRYAAIEGSRKINNLEGCISYNGGKDKYIIERYNIIKASWSYFSGSSKLKEVEAVLEGNSAIIFQHETDHLNGITIANKGERCAS